MKDIYFCSDFHFCHNKDFIYKERGFSSIEEMNEVIIQRYNSLVREEDLVFILGDLMLNDNKKGIELCKRLHGQKKIIYGNHDTTTRQGLYEQFSLRGEYAYLLKFSKKKSFYLSHYPTMTGNFQEKYTPWCLHGHTHSKSTFEFDDHKCYNIGMDAHNCYPVHIDKILHDIEIERGFY